MSNSFIVNKDKKPIIRTLLLENGGLVTDKLAAWIDQFDDQYKEINTANNRDYCRADDLWFFGLIINPNIETSVNSSNSSFILEYSPISPFAIFLLWYLISLILSKYHL